MLSPKDKYLSRHESKGCATCGLDQRVMKLCSRCRNIFYCSRKCQIEDWKRHCVKCVASSQGDCSSNEVNILKEDYSKDSEIKQQNDESKWTINVKCNHKKHKITLCNVESSDGNVMMDTLSEHLKIPVESMKIITKGKLVDEKNIKEMLIEQRCVNFQAFGEEAEDEDGLDAGDIEAIMEELSVSRNKAIQSLRSCNGDLIDAILELGNKL